MIFFEKLYYIYTSINITIRLIINLVMFKNFESKKKN